MSPAWQDGIVTAAETGVENFHGNFESFIHLDFNFQGSVVTVSSKCCNHRFCVLLYKIGLRLVRNWQRFRMIRRWRVIKDTFGIMLATCRTCHTACSSYGRWTRFSTVLPQRSVNLCLTVTQAMGSGVIYPQCGFCKISPSCQWNVTVVFVTLSLNNLGFGNKLRHHYIYFRFFCTGL